MIGRPMVVRPAIFDALTPQPVDGLLRLIKAFRSDPRPNKIDLGVGVYRNALGQTPVMRAVKLAEAILQETQPTKTYLGPEGDPEFLAKLQSIPFGPEPIKDLVAVQTPGGTGALYLAAGLIKAARPQGRVWLGAPTWPNHEPIFTGAGLEVVSYPYFDAKLQAIRFERLLEALQSADAGDVFLLHGCCHNPTGADLTREQWSVVAEQMGNRGLLPLIDLAYQGLADGLSHDSEGLHIVLASVPMVLVAYSCDKNFGLYRERVGALFVRAPGHAALVEGNLLQLARSAWSMPPDHGAAVVGTILESNALTTAWQDELDGMRARLRSVRQGLAEVVPALASIACQNGLFAQLNLGADAADRLRRDHGVYMAASGRINLAGLTPENTPRFAAALAACQQGAYA